MEAEWSHEDQCWAVASDIYVGLQAFGRTKSTAERNLRSLEREQLQMDKATRQDELAKLIGLE